MDRQLVSSLLKSNWEAPRSS